MLVDRSLLIQVPDLHSQVLPLSLSLSTADLSCSALVSLSIFISSDLPCALVNYLLSCFVGKFSILPGLLDRH